MRASIGLGAEADPWCPPHSLAHARAIALATASLQTLASGQRFVVLPIPRVGVSRSAGGAAHGGSVAGGLPGARHRGGTRLNLGYDANTVRFDWPQVRA